MFDVTIWHITLWFQSQFYYIFNMILKGSSIKGYLRYKTITSQNVLFEAQVKNFFIS